MTTLAKGISKIFRHYIFDEIVDLSYVVNFAKMNYLFQSPGYMVLANSSTPSIKRGPDIERKSSEGIITAPLRTAVMSLNLSSGLMLSL